MEKTVKFRSGRHGNRVLFSGAVERLSALEKKYVPALKVKLSRKLDEEANCIFLIKIFG